MSLIPNETQQEMNEWLEKCIVLPKPDSIVEEIIRKFSERAQMGEEKYGVTLDREDLSLIDWLNHALEEHMDAILYLQKIKTILDSQEK
jgi:hypothetical protein